MMRRTAVHFCAAAVATAQQTASPSSVEAPHQGEAPQPKYDRPLYPSELSIDTTDFGIPATYPGAPHYWGTNPPMGWRIHPNNAIDVDSPIPVTKEFAGMDLAVLYHAFGKIMSMACELGVEPHVEWHAHTVIFTIPQDCVKCFRWAQYVTDEEALLSQRAGTVGLKWEDNHFHEREWLNQDLKHHVVEMAERDFCWGLTNDYQRSRDFMFDTFMKWYNRADFLLHRTTKEKREFNPNFSAKQVVNGDGQERRRRLQRRKAREIMDKKKEEAGRGFNFHVDVLPREVRESMDRDNSQDLEGSREMAARRAQRGMGGKWHGGYSNGRSNLF